ncbi:hypothetical protein R3P38DRAFT_3027278 [Favolaschia claudopus]|uniref:F-box protein n=1 Tax=Favolaschia claudopus TaxID=2862362 RepID=A0AAW0AG40_9AGAR
MSASPSTTDSLVLSSTLGVAREDCLQNSDLVAEIVQHIGGGSSAGIDELRRGRHSLLQVALTCRALSPSAIKFLWRSLDNLLPLLQLLPSFTQRNGTYYLLGAMTPHEWDKFDCYAAYVQEIHDESFPDATNIEPSVYLQLAMRKAPILPNLRRMKFMSASGRSPSEILLYALSPLREVEIKDNSNVLGGSDTATMGEVIFSALGGSATRNSWITTLVLTGQRYTILSDNITLDRLESLTLEDMKGTMDASVIRWIGSIPTLHSLTLMRIRVIREQDVQDRSLLLKRGSFKGLLHLRMEGFPDSHPGLVFLRLISSTILQTLTLQIESGQRSRPNPAAAEIKDFPRIIAQWSQSLCDLELSAPVFCDQEDFHSLFGHLRHLRRLHLRVTAQTLEAGEFFRSLGVLSEIETLSLNLTFADRLGMDLVVRLAQHCPKLQFLQIPLPSTQLTLFSTTPVSGHNLKTLVVLPIPKPRLNNNSLVDAVNVARHLDRLFPRLTAVRYYIAEGSHESQKWKDVQELVFAFQDVRRCAKIQ